MSNGSVLSRLLNDASVSDIFINGINGVYVERNGRIEKCEPIFENELARPKRYVKSIPRNIGITIAM